MSTLVAGLFTDSKQAGDAVAQLKNKGYTDNISLIAKDEQGDTNTHQIKEDVSEGAAAGAVVGGPIGALTGLVAGAVTATIPGAVLLIGGPLAVTWGVTGAAVGALGGGLVGALVDAGFPDERAKMFEEHILKGEVLVSVTTEDDAADTVFQDFKELQAYEIVSIPQE